MGRSPAHEIKTRRDLAERISTALMANGRDATPEVVLDVLEAWLAGHPAPLLPAGTIGVATAVILEDIEFHLPGALADLS